MGTKASATNIGRGSGGLPRADFWVGTAVLALVVGLHLFGGKRSGFTSDSTSVFGMKVDKVRPRMTISIGIATIVVAAGGAAALYPLNGPVGSEGIWMLARIALFFAVVGVAVIVLGIYMKKILKAGKVFYRLGCREYGALVLQLAPGFVLSWLGNTLEPEYGWLSLGIGTALSVLFLRKTGPKPTP
jgi:hypothetical protein